MTRTLTGRTTGPATIDLDAGLDAARPRPVLVGGAPDGAAALEARGLSAWFGEHKVLDRVDLVMPAGAVTVVGSPYRIDERRPRVRRAPPLLGEHTVEVLTALGLDGAQIAEVTGAHGS